MDWDAWVACRSPNRILFSPKTDGQRYEMQYSLGINILLFCFMLMVCKVVWKEAIVQTGKQKMNSDGKVLS